MLIGGNVGRGIDKVGSVFFALEVPFIVRSTGLSLPIVTGTAK
jgi:hypothetical protein